MSEKTEAIAPVFDDVSIPSPSASKLLIVSASPHIHCRESVPQMMLWVLIALLPAAIVAVMFSGMHALYSMLLSIITATAAEWVISFFAYKKRSIPDGSAPVTGLLLALSLPPLLPLWVAPLGSLFAIALVKMAFGGLGRNFLNPAMAGRAFLVAAFPVFFSTLAAPPGGGLTIPTGVSEINSALLNFLTGYQGGWMGGASAGALLAGAILLWGLRIIDFTLPLSFIGSIFLLFWCTNESTSLFSATAFLTPLFQLLSSGILFGAFFLATDPVTSPSTARSRLLFGIGCGIFTFIFQRFGPPNDSIMQAILLMNCTVPYMDRYLIRRTLSRRSPMKKAVSGKSAAKPQETEPAPGPAVENNGPQEIKTDT